MRVLGGRQLACRGDAVGVGTDQRQKATLERPLVELHDVSVARVEAANRLWPGALERFITRRLRLKDIRSALERPKGDLKTVVELVSS